jgi:hypothetical protein
MTSQPVCLTCLPGGLIRDFSTRKFLFNQKLPNIVLYARFHNAWHALMVQYARYAIKITLLMLIMAAKAAGLVFLANTISTIHASNAFRQTVIA